ncbi:hypothetical protein [Alkalicoccobacillus porphyridii]|uniref:Uncharacterized protein n=1 Tax=Alkalicoccobacillus porphyridii TaxID=2597270 RepID=A0A553ZZC7_9BACI|nr:hypothetical protein [Alkalicoccobacillus porphyridii]TSB46798.1 hypothetical protein FN960_10670 [Alkalicoccobacillus porphyridii]
MKTRTKAAVCGLIFLVMLACGWISDHAIMEKRNEQRRGLQIQGELGGFYEDEFAPREYIKIRPKLNKKEQP